MNMKKFFYRLTPKYYGGINEKGGRWSSFRWFGNGYDSSSVRGGFRYVQFGRNPVKFIARIPESDKVPTFLLGSRWKTLYFKWGYRIGITTKPKDFTKLWRIIDGNRNRKRVRTERSSSRLLQ